MRHLCRLQLFEAAGISNENADHLIKFLNRAVEMLAAEGGNLTNTPALTNFKDAVESVFKMKNGLSVDTAGLYKVSFCLCYTPSRSTICVSFFVLGVFQVHVYEEKPSAKAKREAATNLKAAAVTSSVAKGRSLGYWCFSAGLTMKEIISLGVRSVILASGTLSPMDSWAAEMQIPFDVSRSAPASGAVFCGGTGRHSL